MLFDNFCFGKLLCNNIIYQERKDDGIRDTQKHILDIKKEDKLQRVSHWFMVNPSTVKNTIQALYHWAELLNDVPSPQKELVFISLKASWHWCLSKS